jgi:hypothetical protein
MFANVDPFIFGMCRILVEELILNKNTIGNWHVNAKYLLSSTRAFLIEEPIPNNNTKGN